MDTPTSNEGNAPASLTSTVNTAHNKNSGMAVLAYLGILVVVPFLTEAKNDSFVKFHMKQGLVLLIVEVITWFIETLPFFGWFLGSILWLFIIVMIIIGILNALGGKEKELPFIGQFGRNFNF